MGRLNSKNMQISIIEINRESICLMLNKLPYLSYGRHLKSRYVNVAIKVPKIEYRSETTCTVMNHKYI